ncbi:sigma-70 family RNA polymerase sigma factor [Pedobacter frigiditerrae]|uniref:Sigma-70 family RNA polymerase sigma factor n=2 Tax=Pedobacter frigiditerrae TaxID=2530452 RepID=A0A4R0MU60_9SPHI|nr:sigma-70 family RNA polymerase sigma factor [Pedobacter frigiditerrae]
MIAIVRPFNKLIHKELHISTAPSAEEILVTGLKNGDTKSIEKLYKMYASSLMGIISRIVKFDEVAEDVLQDTFLKIWKSIAHYDASKGRLFTWMANLAKNTAIDQVRSKNYLKYNVTDEIEDRLTKIDQENLISINPDRIGLKQLTEKLKQDQFEIIQLFYFEGYTQSEVAKELNIPLGTVKTKLRQSILALRQYFNETNTKLKFLIA